MDQTERVEVFIPKGYAGEDPNYLVRSSDPSGHRIW